MAEAGCSPRSLGMPFRSIARACAQWLLVTWLLVTPCPPCVQSLPECEQHRLLDYMQREIEQRGPPDNPLRFIAAWASEFRS